MPSAGRGASLALASAAAFATTGILSQFAFGAGANIVSLLSGRYLLCAALLWSTVALLRLGVPARRDALLVLGLGAGLISIQSCLFFHSLQRIPPGLADMLMFVYPALVTAGAILLRREQLSRRRVASSASPSRASPSSCWQAAAARRSTCSASCWPSARRSATRRTCC